MDGYVDSFFHNVFKGFLSHSCLTLYHTILTSNDHEKKKKKTLENIVGKGENAGNQHFLLFPQCFLPFLKQSSVSESHLLSSANAFNLDKSKILLFGRVNPFPHNTFCRPWETSLLKTLWEKEKLLVTSNFSFSQCFPPAWTTFCHFRQI